MNTILFDLDGTLLNTLKDLQNSVNYALEQQGYPLRNIEEIRNFVGDGVAMLIHRSVPTQTTPEAEAHCLSIFKEHYMIHMYDNTKPYDGILPLLYQLKEKGYRLGIVSNKLESAVQGLAKDYFENLFDVAIGDVPSRNKKPAPDSVLAAIQQLSVRPSDCLYIGDTNIDVETAHNAGIVCVGVTWGFRDRSVLLDAKADYIIDTPEQLFSVL